jgi:hypothetical protein
LTYTKLHVIKNTRMRLMKTSFMGLFLEGNIINKGV